MESTLSIRLAVNGTLMRGFELNGNLIAAYLVSRGAA